ncbi:hypothetical protein ACFX1Q_041252 [Malus domestica]
MTRSLTSLSPLILNVLKLIMAIWALMFVCQHSSLNSSDLQESAKICDIANEDGMTLVLSKSQKSKDEEKD